MTLYRSALAAAAVALVPLTQAWNIELPPCIEPFKPFVYSGCFQDGNPNALIFRSSIDQNNMTVEKCIAECKGNGFRYAGLEYYGVCFCGATVNGAQLDESKCSFPCSGNKTQTCGGDNTLSVYQDPTFPTEDVDVDDYKLLGCYTDDSTKGRTLSYPIDLEPSTFTTKKCLAACEKEGFPFAGVEFGKECWCGVVLANDTAKVDTSQCNMPCQGDASDTCGGRGRMNLWVAKDLESLEPCGHKPSTTTTPLPPITTTTKKPSDTTTTQKPTTTTTKPDTTTKKPSTTSTKPDTTTKKPTTTTKPDTTTKKPTTTSTCDDETTTTKKPTTTTTKPDTTTKKPTTTTKPDTTTKKPTTTTKPDTTTKKPSTTTKPDTTTKKPSTTTKPDTTTKKPTTTTKPDTTTRKPTTTSTCDDETTTTKRGTTTKKSTSTSTYDNETTTTRRPHTTTTRRNTSTKPTTTTKRDTTTTRRPHTTTTKRFTTTTKPTTTKKVPHTTTNLCTATVTLPPKCEWKCGNWCAPPLPPWADRNGCTIAQKTCHKQISSCFKNAGWPGSVECFKFKAWCAYIDTYCSSSCPSNKCGKSDCWNKHHGGGKPPGNPPTTTTTVYPCPTTSKPVPTTTKPGPGCPKPTNICTQPTNQRYGYGPGKPVGGIPLPVVDCNDVKEEFDQKPFKFYTDADTRKCPGFPWPQWPNVCAQACKEQYTECVETYIKGCEDGNLYDRSWSSSSSSSSWSGSWSGNGGAAACAVAGSGNSGAWARAGSDNVQCWGKGGNKPSSALERCKAQYQDCVNVNQWVNPRDKCKYWPGC